MSDNADGRQSVNPSGICFCGCGKATPIAAKTAGEIRKGDHYRRCRGHKGERGLLISQGRSNCKMCGEIKPLEDFYFSSAQGAQGGGGKYMIYCKPCCAKKTKASFAKNGRPKSPERSAYMRSHYQKRGHWQFIQRKYGITADEYQELHDAQGGVCAICRRSEEAVGRSRLSIDHDHVTGKTRGLLCGQCNIGLGNFQDDPALLTVAAGYLEKFSAASLKTAS